MTSKDHREYRRIGFKPNVPESLFHLKSGKYSVHTAHGLRL